MGGDRSSSGEQAVAPDPAPTPPFIGIDLGCSHSVVAVYLGNGNVEVIPNDIGNRTTPSVVAFLRAERLVGEAAVVQAAINPCATVRNVKRILGRLFKSIADEKFAALGSSISLIQEDEARPLLMLKSEDAPAHVKIRPEEVAAMLLSFLKKSAEQFLKQEVTEASIAVPAYFDAAQRLAVQQSGVIAGFKRVRLVNDTSATALTFALDRAGTRTVVVVDIGGGGGSVSVVEASLGGYVKVLATFDQRVPGGDDLDARVLADITKEIFGNSVHLSNERSSEILLSSWTKAKEKLIHRQQTTMKVFVPGIDRDFEKVLQWEDFLEHLQPMLESVEIALKDVLKESGRSKSHVHDVVLVGGCSRIPILRSAVRDFFDGKEPCRAVNADEGVACGAALYSASLSRDRSVESVLEDITPLGMRIRSKEGTFNILKRNQQVPCRINQEMRVFLSRPSRLFVVEQSVISNWKLLCKIKTPSPYKPLSLPPVKNVHFLSQDGLLSLNTGLPRDAKYEVEFWACLNDYQVQLLKERIEKYFQMEDDRNRKNEEKNRLENLLRDLQARQAQFGEDEIIAKQTLKKVAHPFCKWFLSNQAASTEEYRKEYLKAVNALIGLEDELPDTEEWRAYLRELKHSHKVNESGDSERKRPRLGESGSEVHGKEPPKNELWPTGTGVETRQSKRLENADQQPRVTKPDSKRPGHADKPSVVQLSQSKLDLKRTGDAVKSSQALPRVSNHGPKLCVNRSTKPACHSEISEKQGSGTEEKNKKSKDDGEASGAARPTASNPEAAHNRQVAESTLPACCSRHPSPSDGDRVAAGDVLGWRLAHEEPHVLVLRRIMWEVRQAGPFCLMLYTITTERRDFVAMMLRYCTPGHECTPVERLVALLDAGGVTAAALHERFTTLCKQHGMDWCTNLLAVSMDAVRSTYNEFCCLLWYLQAEAGHAIRLVWDSANSLGNLMMAKHFENSPEGTKFFVYMEYFRDLFRHEGRRADLARHCEVHVKEVEFTSYEDTVIFVSKHLKKVREFLGQMKDMYNEVTAACLCECLIDRDFVAVLLTLDHVFTATKTLTKCLRDTYQVGLTSALDTIHSFFSPHIVNHLVYSILNKLSESLGSMNAKCEVCFGSMSAVPQLITSVLYAAINCINIQLFYCYDMLMDINYLGQILIVGGMNMPSTNFLSWHPVLQGENRRSLFREMEEIEMLISSGIYPYQPISHSNILRSPSFPSVAFGLRALLTLPLLPAEQGNRKVVKLRRCLQSQGANPPDLETQMILLCASAALPQEHDEAVFEIVEKIGNL